MNILLIGGADSLMNQMIIKLKKEGHRVYLLTGSRYARQKYERVFEIYRFPYDSECMGEIFESIRPDVTLFMGAYDANFHWVDLKRDSVHFTTGLIHLLSAFSGCGHGRFVYLSSQEVFAGDYPEDITEDAPVTAEDLKGMALAQGEKLCESYRINCKADVVTLRLENLYTMPESRGEVQGICAGMCLSALANREITVNVNHRFSMIYAADAIEAVYRLMTCGDHFDGIYHISSGEEISELSLAEEIRKTAGEDVVIHKKSDLKERKILSKERFDLEFDVRIFHPAKETAHQMMAMMMEQKDLFLTGRKGKKSFVQRLREHMGWLLKALFPFLENLVCFLPFFMLNNRAVGSEYFANLDFYLLYVLLFAIIYGQQQATFSACLAVAGYLFRQMYHRSAFHVLLDYNTYVWIAQLFILGLVVGYMRDQIKLMKSESRQEREYLTTQLGDMTDINQSNVRVKDALETQIVNHNDSIGKIYHITSRLDRYMPQEVLFYAAETVAKLMNSKDVAVYTVSNEDYARLVSATSKTARQYGYSIRYGEMEELTRAVSERRVYINRSMDKRYPNMAAAIYDGDKLQLILMVWGLSWEQMTLGQANLLVVVSYLIQNAVLRANRYMEALEDKRYVEGEHILEPDAFAPLVKAFYHASHKDLAECVLLRIEAEPPDYAHAGAVLEENLRQSDYLGILRDGRLYALLANTAREDATTVISRFEKCGYRSRIMEEMRL